MIHINLVKPNHYADVGFTRTDLLKIGAKAIDVMQRRCARGVNGHQILKALGRPGLVLAPMRQDTLQNLLEFDLAASEEIGNHVIRELSRQLTMNTLAGVRRSSIIKAMDAVLEGQSEGQGVLYADTALKSFRPHRQHAVVGRSWY